MYLLTILQILQVSTLLAGLVLMTIGMINFEWYALVGFITPLSSDIVELIYSKIILKRLKKWQRKPLKERYAIICLNTINYQVKNGYFPKSYICRLVTGIDVLGRKEFLSLSMEEKENASPWSEVLYDLRNRGIKEISFLCSNKLELTDTAAITSFPKHTQQICVVNEIKQSIRIFCNRHKKTLEHIFKVIFEASDSVQAMQAYNSSSGYYRLPISVWKNNWNELTAFLNLPLEIKRQIYTTDVIEELSSLLPIFVKGEKTFNSDHVAKISVYDAVRYLSKKWKKPTIEA